MSHLSHASYQLAKRQRVLWQSPQVLRYAFSITNGVILNLFHENSQSLGNIPTITVFHSLTVSNVLVLVCQCAVTEFATDVGCQDIRCHAILKQNLFYKQPSFRLTCIQVSFESPSTSPWLGVIALQALFSRRRPCNPFASCEVATGRCGLLLRLHKG